MRSGVQVVCVALSVLAACGGEPRELRDAREALARGHDGDAFRAARVAVEARPGSAQAQLLLAAASYRTMRTAAGVEAAARAVELDPADPRAHRLSALLDQRRFRNVAAVKSALEATRLAPNEADHHRLLGEMRLGGGMVGTADYDGALAAFGEALRLDPSNGRARFGLAKTLVLAGEHERGEEELDGCLARGTRMGEAHYLRGVARMRRRDFEGSERDFREAVRLDPTHPPSYFNLARVLEMRGKPKLAARARERYPAVREQSERIRQAEIAFHSSALNPPAGMALARLWSEAGRREEAYGLLETLCADFPGNPSAHLLFGELAIAMERLDAAGAILWRARELAPDDARVIHAVARLERARGSGDEALAHARDAARLAPEDPEIQLTLGRLLLETGDPESASKVFRNVETLVPGLPAARAGLGEALFGAGRAQEGEASLSAALRARPQNPDWLYARGRARAELGNAGWAEEDFRTAIAVNPLHVSSYEELSRLLEAAGRRDEAAETADRLRDLRRAEREIEKARRTLIREPRNGEAARVLIDRLRETGRTREASRLEAWVFRWEELP